MPGPAREPLGVRMLRLTDRSGECWTWLGSKDAYGYGQMGVGHTGKRKAHRVAWELEYGEIPIGMHVLHRCDNRGCVRPEHLFLGDQRENMYDAIRKGRHLLPTGVRTPSASGSSSGRPVAEMAEKAMRENGEQA